MGVESLVRFVFKFWKFYDNVDEFGLKVVGDWFKAYVFRSLTWSVQAEMY